MNLYGPDFFDDDALIAEIKAYAAAKRTLSIPGGQVAVIQGEGRRVEFVGVTGSTEVDTALRQMMYEARQRNLSIGGNPDSAITVEIG